MAKIASYPIDPLELVNLPILSSTFALTLLLMVGLFFFIKASTKDRTQQIRYSVDPSDDGLLENLKAYFLQRAYRIIKIDSQDKQVIFEGFVRPSGFLALFLSLLAAVGFLCLGLILSILFPQGETAFLWLILLSPLAGYFYWRRSGRLEQASLQLASPLLAKGDRCYVTVTAHRDELAQLQRAFPSAEEMPEN